MSNRNPRPLPIALEEINADWLTAALAVKAPDITVNSVEVVNMIRGTCTKVRLRLEVDEDCPQPIWQMLLDTLGLTEDDLYIIDGPVNPTRLMALYEGSHSPHLRDTPYIAPTTPSVRDRSALFSTIRRRDLLLHSPYESFGTVVDFLELAARDYSVSSQLSGKPASALVIFPLPGSTAIDTSDAVRANPEEIVRNNKD